MIGFFTCSLVMAETSIEDGKASINSPFSAYSLYIWRQHNVFIHREPEYCNGDIFAGCVKRTVYVLSPATISSVM